MWTHGKCTSNVPVRSSTQALLVPLATILLSDHGPQISFSCCEFTQREWKSLVLYPRNVILYTPATFYRAPPGTVLGRPDLLQQQPHQEVPPVVSEPARYRSPGGFVC